MNLQQIKVKMEIKTVKMELMELMGLMGKVKMEMKMMIQNSRNVEKLQKRFTVYP